MQSLWMPGGSFSSYSKPITLPLLNFAVITKVYAYAKLNDAQSTQQYKKLKLLNARAI